MHPEQTSPDSWLNRRAFRWALATAYVVVPVWVLYVLLGKPAAGADDANIFFVYARNFVHGHGIVYSIGGPHVEGYSSVLYLLLCSLCYVVTANPETLLLLLNAAFTVVATAGVLRTLFSAAQTAGITTYSRLALAAAYLIWLFLNPSYFAWNVVTLMDGGLYSLTIVVTYALLAAIALGEFIKRERLQMSFAVALLILARPEGILWAACALLAYTLLRIARGAAPISFLRTTWQPFATFLGVEAVLVGFRLAYFGYPLPNTYYAKVSASSASTWTDGWDYLAKFVAAYSTAAILPIAAIVVLLCATAYILLTQKRQASPLTLFALVAVIFGALGVIIPVLEGGDHFNGYRLFQPVYPLLGICLLTPVLYFPILRQTPRVIAYATILTLAIGFFPDSGWSTFAAENPTVGRPASTQFDVMIEFNIANWERLNGERMNVMFAGELPSMGSGSAGGIAYSYNGRVYDMMGLNDARMAHADAIKSGPKGHQSFNRDVFFAIAPNVLLSRTIPATDPVSMPDIAAYYTTGGSWDNMMFKNLFNDPQFHAQYTLAMLTGTSPSEFKCYGFFNNNYLQHVAAEGKFQIQTFQF